MIVDYRGNFVIIRYPAGEKPKPFQLTDGYCFETISAVGATNINVIYTEITFAIGAVMTFPPVNSKSPCVLYPFILDKAFEPILVTGDDGKEHKVIPSDQFK